MTEETTRLEDCILESSTKLVSLNTMIPKYARDMLEECKAWLQTSEALHTYTLQKTTLLAIEIFHQYITEERMKEDRPQKEEAARMEISEVEAPRKDRGEIVSFPQPKEKKGFITPSGLTAEDIADMNKSVSIRVRERTEEAPRVNSNSKILDRLGLKL
jgi:hypothetical protein